MEHLEIVTLPTVTQSGTLTSGLPTVTGLTTSALAGAVKVSGTGIPLGTYVQSIDSASQVTLTADATATGAASLTFTLEPVSLAQAKAQLRVDFTADDAVIAGFIGAARRHAETLLRQTLLTTVYDWYMDGFPSSGGGYFNRVIRQMGPNPQWLPNGAAILYLPKPPIVSVASVKYVNSSGTLTTIDASTYQVSTGQGARIQPITGQVWPVNRQDIDSVVVRYTAGVANADLITDDIKSAMLLVITYLYENRGEADVTIPSAIMDLLASSDQGLYA
jgi:hypothetical protein